ncbi:HAD hydrolase-like protein [Corynebacterium alimapuense]|uniref:HAD family hydrolase n=1 Tax=Corynebacterium alimapuense TaxID=1576874 RepID=A0A3M8K8V4_9CORY|nr:HAD hydrolase-like protein [Corynebacterium alimapuense]RNE49556.1 HAD family hydrolase [Corynebacterium alimapuense]
MSILLLDVDGTLIDSLPGIRAGFLHALDALDWEHPSEEFISQIAGPPMELTLKSLGMTDQQAQQGLASYLDYTHNGGWEQASPFPGMLELLVSWKQQGLTIATATSKGEGFARRILEREGFLDYIDFLGAAQENGPRRAKADVIDYVLASNGWRERTSDIVMVGDRSHDIEGAAHFDIDTIAVTWGYGTPQEWETAYRTARTPEDLERIINARLLA